MNFKPKRNIEIRSLRHQFTVRGGGGLMIKKKNSEGMTIYESHIYEMRREELYES